MTTKLTELYLCESAVVLLRPDLTYKFVIDPECAKCTKHYEAVKDTMPKDWTF